jgi:hypothetical protein
MPLATAIPDSMTAEVAYSQILWPFRAFTATARPAGRVAEEHLSHAAGPKPGAQPVRPHLPGISCRQRFHGFLLSPRGCDITDT